jgi:predicted dehydrogenase
MIARQHLGALAGLGFVDVVGVADLSRGMAGCAAERFGVPRTFDSAERLIHELKPDVVHITTPPSSHFTLAKLALLNGCHVFVEKPVTSTCNELDVLLNLAAERSLIVVEDLNYLFNDTVLRARQLLTDGHLGTLVHVEVCLALDLLSPGHPFSDPNIQHPVLKLPGGAIHDFLPHLASLVALFLGAHRSVNSTWEKFAESPLPYDEFRGLILGERATATVMFSARAQPDQFSLRLNGTKARVTVGLFEPRFTVERLVAGPKPLIPVRNAWGEATSSVSGALGGLRRKLAPGPGAYEGLHELVRQTYSALRDNGNQPLTPELCRNTSQLVRAMTTGVNPAASPLPAEHPSSIAHSNH